MDHNLCVLLYSKYSTMSKKLFSILESSPINISSVVGLSPVCIDNEDIRDQILNDKKIDISLVPCILVVYQTGSVEKYEGENAFQWVNEIIRVNMPQTQPQPQPQPQPQTPPKKSSRKSRSKRNEQYYEEDSVSSEEDYKPVKRKHSSSLNHHSQKSKSSTSMEELGIGDNDNNDEESEENTLHRPPVGVLSGPGGYDITSEFGEPQEINRDASRHMKNSTQPATGKGADLMAAAMAMQKERESVDSKQPRTTDNVSINKRPI